MPKIKMKQLDLPFKIDKQIENWEFELVALDDRLIGYQSYRYTGKEFKHFLNFTTQKTELIFNADYLTAVIITIDDSDTNRLSMIKSFLVQNASKEVVLDEYTRRYKIYSIIYYTVSNDQKNQILIVYGKPRFMRKSFQYLL
jgi:hypothetical protein